MLHCGHLSGTQGVLLGSPQDRREEVSRNSPWESRVRGLVEMCTLRHSGLSPLCEESLTKDQRSHPAKSCRHGQPTVRPRVGRGGAGRDMGSTCSDASAGCRVRWGAKDVALPPQGFQRPHLPLGKIHG